MNTAFRLHLVPSILLSLSCVHLAPQHQTGSHPQFPAQDYITASGFSDHSLAQAAATARLNVLAQINTAIQSLCIEVMRSNSTVGEEVTRTQTTCRTYTESSFPYADLIQSVPDLGQQTSQGWYQFFVLDKRRVVARLKVDAGLEQRHFVTTLQQFEQTRSPTLWLALGRSLRRWERLADQSQVFGRRLKYSVAHQSAIQRVHELASSVPTGGSVGIVGSSRIARQILQVLLKRMGVAIESANSAITLHVTNDDAAVECRMRRKVCCYSSLELRICSEADRSNCVSLNLPRIGDCHATSEESALRKLVRRHEIEQNAIDALELSLGKLFYFRHPLNRH